MVERHNGLLCAFFSLAGFILAPPIEADDAGDAVAVDMPQDILVGYYFVLSDNEPVRRTMREEQKAIASGDAGRKREARELRGKVLIPKGSGLSVSIVADVHGSVGEKLVLLRRMPPTSIRALTIISAVDLAGLECISQMESLRDLTLSDCVEIESKAGAQCLSCLKELRYLNIGRGGESVFGSKSLCDAIVSLRKLAFLVMPCEKLRSVDGALLASHSSLESIIFLANKPVFGRETLRAFHKTPRLRELVIVCTDDLTPEDVMAFADKKTLEYLSIISDSSLDCLDRLKQRRPDCVFLFPSVSD